MAQQTFFFSRKPVLAVILVVIPAVLAWLSPPAAQAGERASLYDVQIDVVDESAPTRQAAFRQGLEEVFIRLSGDSVIASKLNLPSASGYVKLYRYQPVEQPVVTDDGEVLAYRLTVQYNGTRVVETLRKQGFPVWGEHRSALMVWLAVRDGHRQYVLKQQDQSLIKQALDRALQRRGVIAGWPRYDRQDRDGLGIADIQGGFAEPLIAASGRYPHGSILSASLRWNGVEWQSGWTLLINGDEYRWQHHGNDYVRLIEEAVDQVADVMGEVFAVRDVSGEGRGQSVLLDVRGIRQMGDYKRVTDYLQLLEAIKTVVTKRVAGEQVTFEVGLRSRLADLITLLKADAVLLAEETEAPVQGAPGVRPPPSAPPAASTGRLALRLASGARAGSVSPPRP